MMKLSNVTPASSIIFDNTSHYGNNCIKVQMTPEPVYSQIVVWNTEKQQPETVQDTVYRDNNWTLRRQDIPGLTVDQVIDYIDDDRTNTEKTTVNPSEEYIYDGTNGQPGYGAGDSDTVSLISEYTYSDGSQRFYNIPALSYNIYTPTSVANDYVSFSSAAFTWEQVHDKINTFVISHSASAITARISKSGGGTRRIWRSWSIINSAGSTELIIRVDSSTLNWTTDVSKTYDVIWSATAPTNGGSLLSWNKFASDIAIGSTFKSKYYNFSSLIGGTLYIGVIIRPDLQNSGYEEVLNAYTYSNIDYSLA